MKQRASEVSNDAKPLDEDRVVRSRGPLSVSHFGRADGENKQVHAIYKLLSDYKVRGLPLRAFVCALLFGADAQRSGGSQAASAIRNCR